MHLTCTSTPVHLKRTLGSRVNSTSISGRGARPSYQTMLPEISAQRSLLFQMIPVAWQGGREMSAPRPNVTDPFHSLNSIQN